MFQSDRQILITGCYRTGSEYITLLLNNHPRLAAAMYVCNFMRFCYDRYNPVDLESNFSALLADAAKRIESRWGKRLDVDRIMNHCFKQEKVTYGVLYDLMMSGLFLRNGKTGWAEKTQLVWTKIPAFLAMFPNGKVIHIIRDPRSVLASFRKFTFAPSPAYLGAIFNCYDSMKKSLEFKAIFTKTQYCTIKYEDILTNPERTLTGLFKFLDLSYDHDLFNTDGWKDARGNKWHHNSAFPDKDEPIGNFNHTRAIHRWQEELSAGEIAFCEAVNSEYMQVYNYGKSMAAVNWKEFVNPLLTDETLDRYYRLWAEKNEGIEEFPCDPLKPENWQEYRG